MLFRSDTIDNTIALEILLAALFAVSASSSSEVTPCPCVPEEGTQNSCATVNFPSVTVPVLSSTMRVMDRLASSARHARRPAPV